MHVREKETEMERRERLILWIILPYPKLDNALVCWFVFWYFWKDSNLQAFLVPDFVVTV